MKPFIFSLGSLLKVKHHAFEKDAIALANLQKKIAMLEKRKEELISAYEEMVEALVEEPSLAVNLECLQEKVQKVEKKLEEERNKRTLCQKVLSDSLQKRKVLEKIRESHYALYKKECARFYEKQR